MRKQVLAAVLLLSGCGVVNACTGGRGGESDWQQIAIRGEVCFKIPASLIDTKARGTDSAVAVWRDDRLELTYDYGWYSSDLSEFDDQTTSRRDATVGGREARFIETSDLVALHVPSVNGPTRFTLIVRLLGDQARETARQILGTVRLKPVQKK